MSSLKCTIETILKFKYILMNLLFIIINVFLVVAERPQDLTITTSPSPTLSQHTYRVVCRKLGEQQLMFTVGNGPTTKNHIPANETTTIRYNYKLVLMEFMCVVI